MEPQGSITKYYPFIDNKTKELAQSLFKNSDNYQEFAVKYIECISSDLNPSEEKIVLGMRIAWHALNDRVMSSMSKYESCEIIQPWKLQLRHAMGVEQDIERIMGIMDRVIETTSDESIIVDVLTLKAYVLIEEKPRESLKILDKVEELIESNHELLPFRARMLLCKGDVFCMLDEYSSAYSTANEALEIAKRFNDQHAIADSHFLLSWGVNANEAIKELQTASSLNSVLGIDFWEDSIETNIGFHYVRLGEYEKAIVHYEKAIEAASKLGKISVFAVMNLAVIYGNLGYADKALQYASRALELAQQSAPYSPAPKIEMARALILNGNFDDAFEYLESGGQLAFERESKKEQARYYLVRGTLERERGNIKAAVQAFEKGLKLAEDVGNPYHIFRILFNLAEAQVALYGESEDKGNIDSSSLALSRIEQLATEQNLPGLAIQALGLKADLYKMKGRKERARSLFEEALKICDASKLNVMREDLEKRLEELDKEEPAPSLLQRFKSLIRFITVPQTRPSRIQFTVLGCIVLLKEMGLEVFSKYTDKRLTSDPSLVAGLISAVSSFAHELTEDTKGELESIVHHNIAVLLEHGLYATCALLVDKDTYEARILAQRFIEMFETKFENFLKQFDGVASPLDAEDLFHTIIIERKSKTQ